jgi:hypothetical protein
MAVVRPAGTADRDDAAAFAGRAARWDPMGPVRIRADGDLLRLWATTPFDALATRAVAGSVEPADVTVHAGNLLSGLAVSRSDAVDPGPAIDATWRAQLPPPSGWIDVDSVPVRVLTELTVMGTDEAKETAGPLGGASTALLDSEVLTVSGSGMHVVIPLRALFALSGMGFAPDRPDESVRVRATDAWFRLDARFGTIVRRRHALLPLFV